jgi:hypothetical protein
VKPQNRAYVQAVTRMSGMASVKLARDPRTTRNVRVSAFA